MSSSPMQLSLFDAAGVAPFSMALDASASTLSVADFHVAGMDFKIPNVKDAEEVLKVALEGLASLQRHQAAMRGAWLWGHGEEDISTWYDEIRATVRRDRTDGIIEIVQRGQIIEINLPDATVWDKHGLGWLLQFQNCCPRNPANSTPWFGLCCGCTSCE